MAIHSKKISAAQRVWLEQYESQTGFEPLHQDDLDSGEMNWDEVVQANVEWFEAWSMDTLLQIQKNNPSDS